MSFKPQAAKEAAIDTGAAVAGAVVGKLVVDQATSALASNATVGQYTQHLPVLVLAGILAAQAFGLAPADNKLVTSALQGASVVTAMQAIRQYSGANDPTKSSDGVAKLVNQYVPGFAQPGQATNAAAAAALNGFGWLGQLPGYHDPRSPVMSAIMAGGHMPGQSPADLSTHIRPLAGLGNPPLKTLGSPTGLKALA